LEDWLAARLLHKLVVQRQAHARAHAQQQQLPGAQRRRLCGVMQDRPGWHGLRQVGCHVGPASGPEVERHQLRKAGRQASVGVTEPLNKVLLSHKAASLQSCRRASAADTGTPGRAEGTPCKGSCRMTAWAAGWGQCFQPSQLCWLDLHTLSPSLTYTTTW